MAKISQLPTLTNVNTGSIIPIVDNSQTQKITIGNLFEFLSGALDQTFATEVELMRSASTSTTNWNTDKEYTLKNTEQLTFSGDYILEDSYLIIEGGEEEVEYSQNKSFKKEGSIFIGGNLLVKDSVIENNGLISVGGEVILIGSSQIIGTGIII